MKFRYHIKKLSNKNIVLRYFFKACTYIYLIFHVVFSNGVSIVAGSLTYNTLLALVPLLLVFFSVLSLLPQFTTIKDGLREAIFSLISPNSQNQLAEVFDTIIAKTSNLGLPSVLSLFVIAFFLIRRIDTTINKQIWHIKKSRSLSSCFTTYWTIISFGPMLLGGLFFVKSYLATALAHSEDSLINSSAIFILGYLQVIVLWFILFFAYTFLPLTKVKISVGIGASLFATILLVVAKNIFIYYITTFPSYYVLYGAIAAFPITVFWLYIVWLLILIGAYLTRILNDLSMKNLLLDYRYQNYY